MTASVKALVNTAVKPIIMIFHSPHREISPMASAPKIKLVNIIREEADPISWFTVSRIILTHKGRVRPKPKEIQHMGRVKNQT